LRTALTKRRADRVLAVSVGLLGVLAVAGSGERKAKVENRLDAVRARRREQRPTRLRAGER
jgi:hypothetical protein